MTKDIWKERYEDINAFERYLARNGVVVRKFFLHVSKEEQRQRFLEPARRARRRTGSSRSATSRSASCWDDYMAAYEEMIRHTATPHAPWYVVPADHKWFTRLVVAGAVIDALEELDLAYPEGGRQQARRAEAGSGRARERSSGQGGRARRASGASRASSGQEGRAGQAGQQGKRAKGAGLAADDGGSAGDGAGPRGAQREHRAVGTEGRGATTGYG